jgi:opacity protein-like surface antigen
MNGQSGNHCATILLQQASLSNPELPNKQSSCLEDSIEQPHKESWSKRMKRLLLFAALLFSFSACAFAQQDYVGRFDVFGAFSFLDSPKLDLQQRGFNTQLGYNARRWLAFGFDYSIQNGHAALVTSDLKPNIQTGLNQLVLAGQAGVFAPLVIPANYQLWAPFNATTQTFTAGPQLAYRHFKKVTLFAHPSIGAIHEYITVKSHDPFTAVVVLPALIATGTLRTLKPNDTTYFYGLGGGADFNATKHFHIRADVEFVHVFLFSDLLKDPRNSVRLSVGPTFNFGRNVSR